MRGRTMIKERASSASRLFGRGPDGVRRVLGVPLDLRGLTEPHARLRAFEPENPSLLVPRAVGVGWDLNIGAVAAKLGLIRPDDSLPDLEQHIPDRVSTMLTMAPLGGAAVVASLGALVGRSESSLPSNWSLTFRPSSWVSAPRAVAVPVVLSVAAGAWAAAESLRHRGGARPQGPEVTASAQALGLQTMSAVLIMASKRAAEQPERRSLLALGGLIAFPAVSTAVLVGTVRAALSDLDRSLRQDGRRA